MPRKSQLEPFDPEIERTLRRRRKVQKGKGKSRVFRELDLELGESSVEKVDSLSHPTTEIIMAANEPQPQNRNLNENQLGNENRRNGDEERMGENNGNNNRRRTIREATTSDVNYDPFVAACPNYDVNFEIKGLLINSLPKFHGLTGEDPYIHLQSLSMICQSMKPVGASLDQVLWKVFHLSLEGKAREWFMSLPRHVANAYQSWGNLKKAFLEKYFPASRTSSMRKEIYSARQEYDESLYDYWNRFQDLLSRCPHHQIPEEQLVQYFYDGLKSQEKGMLDAAAGGSLIDMTAEEAWELIKKMALNHQQYSVRDTRAVHEMGSASASNRRMDTLESKVDSLESKVTSQLSLITAELKNLNVNRTQPSMDLAAPSCETCGSVMHISSVCPSRFEEVSAMYQGKPNQRWDPYSNTYNEGWKSNPKFSWKNDEANNQRFQRNVGAGSSNSNMHNNQQALSLPPKEDTNQLLHNMLVLLKEEKASTSNQFNSLAALIQKDSSKNDARYASLEKRMEQWETKAENLNSFVTQLSNNMSEQQARNGGSIPSNTVINPKGLNAINLRSGRQVGFDEREEEQEKEEEVELENAQLLADKEKRSESTKEELLRRRESASLPQREEEKRNPENGTAIKNKERSKHGSTSSKGKEVNIHELPFPNSYLMNKKIADKDSEKEVYDLFSKVEVNVPLLDLVRKVPKYAKYLKDLCTNKRKFRPNEKVQVSSNVSALFKPQLPVKCQDPGSFTIPCTIGKITIGGALLDLGAAINVMPKSVYQALGVKNLKPTSVVLQLADRSMRYPDGIVEDILIKVKDLVFPADFYVLDMSRESISESTLILGRPFLRTANTMISMKEGSITMEVGESKINFNIYEAMKHPHEDYSLLNVSALDAVIDDACAEFEMKNEFIHSHHHSSIPFCEEHLEPFSEPPDLPFCSCKTIEKCTHLASVDSMLSPPHSPFEESTNGCMNVLPHLNSDNTSGRGISIDFAEQSRRTSMESVVPVRALFEESKEEHGDTDETQKPP